MIDADLAAQIQAWFAERRDIDLADQGWIFGAANGGPNGDGYYPVPVALTGETVMVPSMALLIQIASSGGITATSIGDLPAATSGDKALDIEIPARVPANGSSAAAAKRFHLFDIVSRKTRDLQPVVDAQVDDLLQITRLGSDKQISLGAITSLLRGGYIDLLAPPYNVKPGWNEVKDAETTAGSNHVHSPSGLFTPDDVGKYIFVSNAWIIQGYANGGPMWSVIEAYIDPTTVITQHTPQVSRSGQACGWAWDSTAGVRQAMLDAEPKGDFDPGKTIIVPAGGLLVGSQRMRRRTTLFGYGDHQSFFVRRPALPGGTGLDQQHISWFRNAVVSNGQTDPLTGKTYTYADDFICLINVGFHGGIYYQPGGDYSPCVELIGPTGAEQTAQVDPYWRMFSIAVWDGSQNGIHTFGHAASNVGFVTVSNCQQFGCLLEGYDENWNTVNITSTGQTGLYLGANGGGNGNFTTVKVSYCGKDGLGNRLGTNVTIDGTGNVLTGFRLQESKNSNLTIRGRRNKINSGSIEDTGCIPEMHGGGSAAEEVRAGIFLAQDGTGYLDSYGNEINKIEIGPSVHQLDAPPGGNFASHAVYLNGNATFGSPAFNALDVSTTRPFGVITKQPSAPPTIEAWSYKNYGSGAGIGGKAGPGSWNANTIRVDGQLLAD